MDSPKTNQQKLHAEGKSSQTDSSVEHLEAEEGQGIYSRFSNVALDGTVRKLDAVEDMSSNEAPIFCTDKRGSLSNRQETQTRRDSTGFSINVGTLETSPVQFIF